ncbi:MAG: rane protein of unknown function [Candidatus Saccharibacteria bacterium]|nr:rane protein of unknown function [Candidatus Saccharibacteria bacterium]
MIARLLSSLALMCLCMFAMPLPATAAYDALSGVDCSKTGAKSGDPTSSAVCVSKDSGDPISGSNGILLKITNIIAYIAGAAAVIVIILGGLRYVTSNGDSNNVASAKITATGALIGLAIIIVARSLINYLVNRL